MNINTAEKIEVLDSNCENKKEKRVEFLRIGGAFALYVCWMDETMLEGSDSWNALKYQEEIPAILRGFDSTTLKLFGY